MGEVETESKSGEGLGNQHSFPGHYRLTLDLWLAKGSSSYKRILMAPSCRVILDGKENEGISTFLFFLLVSSPGGAIPRAGKKEMGMLDLP